MDELPHNIEAEQALLGTLLLNNGLLDRVADLIGGPSFYDPVHAALYTLISGKIQAGHLATPITLKADVAGFDPISDDMTVSQYLGRLAVRAANPASVIDYARTIKDLAMRRALVGIAQDLAFAACQTSDDAPASALVEEAERSLFALNDNSKASREILFRDAVRQALNAANDAYARGGALAGLSTGLIDLDARMGGLNKSDLIVLAGRPAMGKSALSMNIAYTVAAPSNAHPKGQHVHFFSQEMSAAQLAMRVLAEKSEIASNKLRRGQFSEDEFGSVARTAERLADTSMTIDETGGLTLAQLVSRARRVKRQRGTALIVIDYIQLMQASRRRENRVQDITEITTGLKALAKDLDVPIIALSQLSRAVETRSDKRPQLSDLRESGSIEQDADIVMFVYRDDYYLSREEPDDDDISKYVEWQTKMQKSTGAAEVIIAKNRHEPTGIVKLGFNASLTQFHNLARAP